MIAPSFICITISGDTINSDHLHDRTIVIVNSCSCGGDTESTKAFYDIETQYKEKLWVIRLDSRIEKTNTGFQIDVDDEFNKDMYLKYRNMYCSRICYVINRDNRVLDKFPVSSWTSNLKTDLKRQ